MLTAYGEVETAVAALQGGAYQYLTKPFNFDEVAHVVEQALAERHPGDARTGPCKQAVTSLGGGRVLVGESRAAPGTCAR